MLDELKMEPKKIQAEFKTEEELQKAYMPFIRGGGIFIRTEDEYALGETLDLSLQMPNGGGELLLQGKVVWLTPDPSKITWISTSTTSGDNMHAGAGFQISGRDEEKFQQKMHELMSGIDKFFLSDTV
jgi:type IV pilus assembly protein PilZ